MPAFRAGYFSIPKKLSAFPSLLNPRELPHVLDVGFPNDNSFL